MKHRTAQGSGGARAEPTAGYNALNQPMMINAPAYNGNWLFFGFDPLGRCVKRWVGALYNGGVPPPNSNPATYFYYDGWNLIQEGLSASSASRLYIHGGRVDEVVKSVKATGEQAFHHYDARGHAILLTNSSGGILEQYEYDAFGQPYFFSSTAQPLNSSTFENRFLFTGREYLSDLKLYDYRHRLYQPELGRFMQPDPIQFKAGDYNLYRYCHNDPVNKFDPWGLLTIRFHSSYPDKGPGRKEVVERAIRREFRRTPLGRQILAAAGTVTIHPVSKEHPKTSTRFTFDPKIKDFDTYLDPTNSRFQDAVTFRELSKPKSRGELPPDNDKGRAAIIGHEFSHGVFKVLNEMEIVRRYENPLRKQLQIERRPSVGGDPVPPNE